MPSTERDLGHLLERAGLRGTRQREAVVRAMDGRTEALTAQELHQELRKRPGAPGLATVYRTLAALADAGVLDSFRRGGEQAFRLCAPKHHHHLVCRRCGSVEEVTSEAVESWVEKVASSRGFRVTDHSADVYGYCASCA